MSRQDIPIACSLTAEELTDRRRMLARIGQAIEEKEERTEGYAFRFVSDDILPELIEIVMAERRCCPFLRFTLMLEPGNGSVWLEVAGPQGTKEFLSSFFD